METENKFKLREVRKSRNVSQLDLAKRLGVHNITILRWEQGVTDPSIEHIFQICEELKTTPNELFGF